MVFSLELNSTVHITCVPGKACSRLTGLPERGRGETKARVAVGRERAESDLQSKREECLSGGKVWERLRSLRRGSAPWTSDCKESRRETLTNAVKSLHREQAVKVDPKTVCEVREGRDGERTSEVLEGRKGQRSSESTWDRERLEVQGVSWVGVSRGWERTVTGEETTGGLCRLSGLNLEEQRIVDLVPGSSMADDVAPPTSTEAGVERESVSWQTLAEKAMLPQTNQVAGAGIDEAAVDGKGEGEEKGESDLPFSIKLTEGQSILLMNVLSFGYGATAVVVKLMEEGAHSAEGLSSSLPLSTQTSVNFFARFAVAALIFTPPMIMRQMAMMKRSRKRGEEGPSTQFAGGRGGLMAGLELGAWMFMAYAGQAIGLESSSADHAELIGTVAVILVPFLEALGGHPISRAVWTGTLLACTGMVLLEGGASMADMGMGGGGFSVPPGDWWCFVSAVCSAIHVVRSELLTERFDSLWLVTSQLGLTATLSLGWLAWEFHAHGMPTGGTLALLPTIPWALILFTGPLGTGMCEWLELEVLRFVHASTATLITTTVPLWGGLLAFFLLGETLDAASLAGAMLILLASVQVQLLSKPTHSDSHSTATADRPEAALPLISPELGSGAFGRSDVIEPDVLITDPIPVFVRDELLPVVAVELAVSRRVGRWLPEPQPLPKSLGGDLSKVSMDAARLRAGEDEGDTLVSRYYRVGKLSLSTKEVGKVSLSNRLGRISAAFTKAWGERKRM